MYCSINLWGSHGQICEFIPLAAHRPGNSAANEEKEKIAPFYFNGIRFLHRYVTAWMWAIRCLVIFKVPDLPSSISVQFFEL